jgi:hypothetical protein
VKDAQSGCLSVLISSAILLTWYDGPRTLASGKKVHVLYVHERGREAVFGAKNINCKKLFRYHAGVKVNRSSERSL